MVKEPGSSCWCSIMMTVSHGQCPISGYSPSGTLPIRSGCTEIPSSEAPGKFA